ncbi:hypothetical protein [Clostridium sp. UBA5988]|uniref:hypothetical protein n=1 Tax=Clostridium sp. UBA5988 TaxID=1946369 RepID=UPI00142E7928
MNNLFSKSIKGNKKDIKAYYVDCGKVCSMNCESGCSGSCTGTCKTSCASFCSSLVVFK